MATNQKKEIVQMADVYGFTDEAASEDQFGIAVYIEGLAKFITKCNTPLTMSIQGSWGTGKTSIMNLVEQKLPKEVVPIVFNTWKYSQFNMDEQLAISLLSSLITKLKIKDTETVKEVDKLLRGLRFAIGLGKGIGLAYIESKTGVDVAAKTEEASKMAKSEKEKTEKMENYVDPTAAITELREQFALCVKKALVEQGKSRVVIFIDDLDRLEPRKAVELLEVLKIFLDCKDCVFVLAIDYDVVCRGVAAKYGSLADNDKDAAEKGKSFFDKIIQVPFKMPVARYDISRYVKSCFEKIGMNFSEEELKKYVELIKKSIGTNPRSMKRLFNSFQLLTIVVPNTLLFTKKNKQLLFAILCLQYCSEEIYNFLIHCSGELTVELFNSIVDCRFDDLSKLVDDVEELAADNLAQVQPFMKKFRDLVDSDGKNGIDDEELENFIQVLSFSAITSATDSGRTTRRGSAIVDNVEDLNMGTMTSDKVKEVIEQLKALGSDVTIQLVKANVYSHVVAKIGGDRGPTFADVYDRKNGYNIDCFVPKAEMYTDKEKYPEIVAWVEQSRYRPGNAANGRRLSPVAYTKAEENSLMEFVRLVYNIWKESAQTR